MNLWKMSTGDKDQISAELEKMIWDAKYKMRKISTGITNFDFLALHMGARHGFFEDVKVLIQNGSDVNAVDQYNGTALHESTRHGHIDIVRFLIQNGAIVNLVSKYKETPLHIAAREGHCDIAAVLIENDIDINALARSQTALHLAARHGHLEVSKLLIQNGADINGVNEKKNKKTPLHWAVERGHLEVSKLLIQNGADINAVNKICTMCKVMKHSVFFLATWGKHVSSTLFLLCYGADVDPSAKDKTQLLDQIQARLKLLRDDKRMGTSLMSDEEKRFMWNLGFVSVIKYKGMARKIYSLLRSFITYKGIFMAYGYDLGDGSIWKKKRWS